MNTMPMQTWWLLTMYSDTSATTTSEPVPTWFWFVLGGVILAVLIGCVLIIRDGLR